MDTPPWWPPCNDTENLFKTNLSFLAPEWSSINAWISFLFSFFYALLLFDVIMHSSTLIDGDNE